MNIRLLAATAVSAGVLGIGGFGIVHAATNQNVGQSGIPRSTFQTARLDAVASILHITPTAITQARTNKTLHTLIQQSGLSRQAFNQQVRAQMTTELEKDGYSQAQITVAFQHRAMLRLRHDEKQETKTPSAPATTPTVQTT